MRSHFYIISLWPGYIVWWGNIVLTEIRCIYRTTSTKAHCNCNTQNIYQFISSPCLRDKLVAFPVRISGALACWAKAVPFMARNASRVYCRVTSEFAYVSPALVQILSHTCLIWGWSIRASIVLSLHRTFGESLVPTLEVTHLSHW